MKKKGPAITVLLPVFNGDPHLRKAIQSVLDQSFTDFELLAINDGSTDATIDTLRNFERVDSRVRVVTRENRGLVYSLNEGVDLARGKWIARMDADDISLSDRLAIQMKYAVDNNLDMCGGAIRTFGACRTSQKTYPRSQGAINTQLLFNTAFAHPTVFVKRDILKKNIYDSRWEKIEDYELWTRLAKNGYRMGNVHDVVLKYRKSLGQTTSKSRSLQDRLRLEIADSYRQTCSCSIPADVLISFHDRSGNLHEEKIQVVLDYFLKAIQDGKDVEGVLKGNLKIFLLHNARKSLFLKGNAIRHIFNFEDLMIFRVFSVLNLTAKKSMWNYLYQLS